MNVPSAFRMLPVLAVALALGCPGDRGGGAADADPGTPDAADVAVPDAPDASACGDALPLACGARLDHSTIVQGRPDTWRGYSCTQRYLSGRETVYAFRTGDACRVSVRLKNLAEDLDVFLLGDCTSWNCTLASSTPLDIQDVETIAFPAEADRDYPVVVDGYDGAEGSYRLETDCLCGAQAGGFGDGEWILKVDRRWNGTPGGVQFPTDPLDEADYLPVDDGATVRVVVSKGGDAVSVGDTPLKGARTTDADGTLRYDLGAGTFAGGRFVVWSGASSLQAELTIYGSGVPIVSSERGPLAPK
jgi:hypothetical protein